MTNQLTKYAKWDRLKSIIQLIETVIVNGENSLSQRIRLLTCLKCGFLTTMWVLVFRSYILSTNQHFFLYSYRPTRRAPGAQVLSTARWVRGQRRRICIHVIVAKMHNISTVRILSEFQYFTFNLILKIYQECTTLLYHAATSRKIHRLSRKTFNSHKKWKGNWFSLVFVHKTRHKDTPAVARLDRSINFLLFLIMQVLER